MCEALLIETPAGESGKHIRVSDPEIGLRTPDGRIRNFLDVCVHGWTWAGSTHKEVDYKKVFKF